MANDIQSIFQDHYSPLCNYATKIIADRAMAEDLVQDLFVKIWEKNILDSIDNHSKYLLIATKHQCYSYLRKNKRNKQVDLASIVDSRVDVLTDLKEEDIEPLLHYFAAKLPEKTRQVFLLSRESKMTYKEISDHLNISQKTVEGQMSRALRIMKKVLKEQEYLVFLLLIQP